MWWCVCGALVIFATAVVSPSTTTSFYMSPSGKDSNSGTTRASPVLTVHRAQQLVRGALVKFTNNSITVWLAPGRYELAHTWNLTTADSGHSATAPVVWKGTGSVVVSGGRRVTGWRKEAHTMDQCTNPGQERDCGFPGSTKDACLKKGCCWHQGGIPPTGRWCTYPSVQGQVWSAPVVPGMTDRQLWVNGDRAVRTTLLESDMNVFVKAPVTPDGYSVKSNLTARWPNGGRGVEFLYTGQGSPWTEARCAVDHVTETTVYMMQPCFYNLVHKPCNQGTHRPTMIENVGHHALRRPGEWSLDVVGKRVYYMAAESDDVNSMDVVAPMLEVLLGANGVGPTPIQNIAFEGISFQHATWLRPGLTDGYVEQQSGSCVIGRDPRNQNCADDGMWKASPGNILLHRVTNLRFEGCEFTHLGGVGLDFYGGSHNNIVRNSTFTDISGAGIQVGRFDTYNVTQEMDQDIGNVMENNLVDGCAVEFRGAVGINVGYSKNTVIVHNDVFNLTYSAMSMGWGWSRHPITYAENNTVAYNRFHVYKKLLNDGGGIYTLGPQQGSEIHHNWVYLQGTSSSGALYPDEGSAYMHWHHNVVTQIGKSEWLHLWTSSIHNITVSNNYVDTHTYLNHGTNCPMIDNVVFPPGKPPQEATAIMKAAGRL